MTNIAKLTILTKLGNLRYWYRHHVQKAEALARLGFYKRSVRQTRLANDVSEQIIKLEKRLRD